ncbi:hypothetical protein C8J46_10226 [Sphingomonas sp. PP-F2F-A104-K0414]|jgi:hypothetical protein|uniref:hypothetical protein n=1 Tax=unclassified Sphingomonas TaxID=196159 RepID=UPI00104AB433|nr:hypothetical protein [Sphingomonas sp. PP-F2F-A104-K0414]TCP99888.1 hypothetical protein C8J46_10226 [Sphingomonas sp. PP-F2F-A104-K0414]
MSVEVTGALVGWKRVPSSNGIMLTIQVAGTAADYAAGRLTRVSVALNDRQLRSLTRDLGRASTSRGLDLRAPRRWWQFGRAKSS